MKVSEWLWTISPSDQSPTSTMCLQRGQIFLSACFVISALALERGNNVWILQTHGGGYHHADDLFNDDRRIIHNQYQDDDPMIIPGDSHFGQ